MSQENVEIVGGGGELPSNRRVREPACTRCRLGQCPGSPFSVKGSAPTAIREWVTEIDEAFEEWEFRPDEVLDAPGDNVVVLSRAWGRGRGTGLEIDMELNVVYTLADGLITCIEGFLPRREALEAAGLSE
jgi:hypothetical protein